MGPYRPTLRGRRAGDNAVGFGASKTEAVLLSRKRGLGQRIGSRAVRVGDREVPFAREAIRWLGVWLDSSLTLRESRRRVLKRARRAEAAVQKLVGKFGAPPA